MLYILLETICLPQITSHPSLHWMVAHSRHSSDTDMAVYMCSQLGWIVVLRPQEVYHPSSTVRNRTFMKGYTNCVSVHGPQSLSVHQQGGAERQGSVITVPVMVSAHILHQYKFRSGPGSLWSLIFSSSRCVQHLPTSCWCVRILILP